MIEQLAIYSAVIMNCISFSLTVAWTIKSRVVQKHGWPLGVAILWAPFSALSILSLGLIQNGVMSPWGGVEFIALPFVAVFVMIFYDGL